MLATLSTTVEFAGLEIDLDIEISGEYADHGIGAFECWGARGVHHEWGWDDLQLSSVFFEPGDVNDALRRRQPHLSRKQFRKAVRRLRRQIGTLIEATAEEWVSNNEPDCIDALAMQNEPDYEEARVRGRSQFACAA
jgi:hypothetical protein